MPNNVNVQHSSAKQSSNGWIFRRHNARSKFVCSNCSQSASGLLKTKKKLSSWSSAFTTILFRARLDQSLSGQKIGRIQMKTFEQGCQTCNTYSEGILDDNEIKKTFYRLYIWILQTFYNVKLVDEEDTEEIEGNEQTQGHRLGRISHDSSRCDGCRVGWCKALYNNRHSPKNQTAFFSEQFT